MKEINKMVEKNWYFNLVTNIFACVKKFKNYFNGLKKVF